jgi:hypothetical protein
MLAMHRITAPPDLALEIEDRALISSLLDPHRGAGLIAASALVSTAGIVAPNLASGGLTLPNLFQFTIFN